MQTSPSSPTAPEGVFAESVTEIEHFTDSLFRFRTTRPSSFRFRSGEFVMIALPGEKPVWRAYSVASPQWDETLDFYSIKVPDGAFTGKLQKIKPGDSIWLRKKTTGTLVLDALLPGKCLWMISTGTGFAPFAALMRDADVYERYERVIVTQTCREIKDLAYARSVYESTLDDPLVGERARAQLTFFTSTTREQSEHNGRISTLISDGSLFESVGLDRFNPGRDRVMICGSLAMIADVRALVESANLTEGANSKPGEYVVERAFVD